MLHTAGDHRDDEKDDRDKGEGDGSDVPYGAEEGDHSAPGKDHRSRGSVSIVRAGQCEGCNDEPDPEHQEDQWDAGERIEVANTDQREKHYGTENYEEYSAV